MNDLLRLLLANLDAAYEVRGWHGTNLRGALRGMTAERALRRPAKGRHNVWELTAHAAYWKYTVRNRLTGGKRGSFRRTSRLCDFATPRRLEASSTRRLVSVSATTS